MKLALLTCILALAPIPHSLAQESAAGPGTAPRFQAECTLTLASVDRLASTRYSGRDKDECAREMLREHAIEHGWSESLAGPDLVEATQAFACSGQVLDRMFAAVYRLPETSEICVNAFAISLQRAGRMGQALRMIDRVLESNPDEGFRESRLAETAANLCEREGLHELALKYAERWHVTARCGIAGDWQRSNIEQFKAENLFALGRYDDVCNLTLGSFQTGWSSPDPNLAWLWVKSEVASGRATSSSMAVDTLKRLANGNEMVVEACDGAAFLCTWVRLDPQAQARQLGEIARIHGGLARRVAIRLGEQGIAEHLVAFDVIGGVRRDDWLCGVLAVTGFANVGPAIERERPLLENPREYLREIWQEARDRKQALTRPAAVLAR